MYTCMCITHIFIFVSTDGQKWQLSISCQKCPAARQASNTPAVKEMGQPCLVRWQEYMDKAAT